ncbi:MAG: CIA30 family protein [Pirellulaceae bacterium]|nr:CIA30 family protein [Pirellulaceae bacterium]
MSQFVSMSLLSASLALFAPSANERILVDFGQSQAKGWRSVNDGVMGGRSVGQSTINSDNNLEFSGTLSLANNGGFSSIRATGSNLRMSKGQTILLRVKGDGRKYNFNLYSRGNLGGYSFRQSFATEKGKWIQVSLPVDKFFATWRGRNYSSVNLNPAEVKGMGILLGDKKAGPFKLEIDWIKLVGKGEAK